MPSSPLVRFLAVVGLVAGGLVAIVGGISLRGAGLVAVGVAGALAGCLGWGMARESDAPRRRTTAESAVLAAAWTVGLLLVLSGASVLAGGTAAALVAGVGAAAAVVVWVVRTPKDASAVAPGPVAPDAAPDGPPLQHGEPLRREAARGAARVLPPVTVLSTEALGQEWLESGAALTGALDSSDRRSIVARRQETLDELERRDGDGFLRWLAAGPQADPARFVGGGPGEPSANDA